MNALITDWTETIGTAVARFKARARGFFYQVVLFDHVCPKCQGRLEMVREGVCHCIECRHRFDPTVAFQRCQRCDGVPRIQICRYRCRRCDREVTSQYLFDGLVFDRAYFRDKMAEHRKRQGEYQKHLREWLIQARSSSLEVPAIDLSASPGLAQAVEGLTQTAERTIYREASDLFNLPAYEQHVIMHVDTDPVDFESIPQLHNPIRMDRIWRFIAVIFLTHAGRVELTQSDTRIEVMKHEAYGERQAVPGET